VSPKILSRIWKDDGFWQLDAAGKVAFFWLLTNGETNNCGHLVFSTRQFESDTGLKAEGVVNLVKPLARAFVFDGQHIWVRNFMRHQWSPGERGPQSKMFKGLVNAIASMPETLRKEALREYPEFYAAVCGITSPLQAPCLHSPPPSNGVSPLQGPYKAPEQSRAEQSRAESSSEGGVGETDGPPVIVTLGMVSAYVGKMRSDLGADYTDAEARSAWMSFHQSRDPLTGQWKIGRTAVTDWRTALEREMGRGRDRMATNGNGMATRNSSPSGTARRIGLEKKAASLEEQIAGHSCLCSAPPYEAGEQAEFDRLQRELREARAELESAA
jgi:hypothetical protein